MTSRQNIRSGDLLIWKAAKYSKFSAFYLNLIRFLTRSEYAHTAIAWVMDGRIFVVEATQPLLRITPLKIDDEFYHIPMTVDFNSTSEAWLIDKIGLKYAFTDAIRAYLGVTVENDRRYQCAELANEFYKMHGIDIGNAYTPAKVVSSILEKLGAKLTYIPSAS